MSGEHFGTDTDRDLPLELHLHRLTLRARHVTAEEIHRLTKIDPWFLQNIKEIIEMEDELVKAGSLAALV